VLGPDRREGSIVVVHVLPISGGLVPLAAMVVGLFTAAWIRAVDAGSEAPARR
jgi:hypothetical protein